MKILIVIDMQNDFVTGSLGTKQAEVIVPKVAKKVESFAGDKNIVVFTKDTHDQNYLNTFEGENLPIEHCIKGTNGWQIVDQLKVYAEKSNAIIDKPTFGSFELLDFLEPLVRNGNIEEIEICGLCTDICVVANALLLRTKFPEMPIKVDATCCAGVSEETHNCALKTMQSCQIEVVY